jgi:putative Mn2+ efflux pump MntP
MNLWEILVLSLALAADAFSVGAAVGLRWNGLPQVLRLSFHFGLFQSIMAGIGALGGAFLAERIGGWDHWLIFTLLALLGLKMIHEALSEGDEHSDKTATDPTTGISVLMLSMAVSLDALGAGIGLGVSGSPTTLAITCIGLVSFLATLLAMKAAGVIRKGIGRHAEWLAGVVLILLGIKILMEHLS